MDQRQQNALAQIYQMFLSAANTPAQPKETGATDGPAPDGVSQTEPVTVPTPEQSQLSLVK